MHPALHSTGQHELLAGKYIFLILWLNLLQVQVQVQV